ncbi:hypothetical protein [Sanguibacter sp. HDW7]|uniref:hypothetical protein n=1 Tax=Sanguibacter sp. HDW7 TaxID=2714931 RepID=UPI0014083F5B|nr:hypothetical protein [Sanguibacter sp. HDW7]QIK82425.1 hypothetical protein G7063_01440 [Sanguibacter sp. HDW7]
MALNDACTHPRARHQHGTYACYTICRCRCDDCRNANRTYENNRARRVAYGRERLTDATPAHNHLDHLRAAGMSWLQIARALGWSTAATKRARTLGRMERDRAAAILALKVTVSLDDLPDGRMVPAVGTRRRLQALACLGWSVKALAEAYRVHYSLLDRAMRGDLTTARTARTVRGMYDDLSMRRRAGGRPSAVARTLNDAARRGWAPPLAWDDIDDPTETPDVGEKARGLDLDEWLHLVLGASIPWWAYTLAALAPGMFAALTVLGMVVVVGILAVLGDTTSR